MHIMQTRTRAPYAYVCVMTTDQPDSPVIKQRLMQPGEGDELLIVASITIPKCTQTD